MLKLLIKSDWAELLKTEFEKEYFIKLESFLNSAYENYNIYPEKKHIFEAFNQTTFKNVKVVILGQDPYHGKNQSHGLSFSVPITSKIPPSLRNIYKELYDDISVTRTNGNLLDWSKQGVLLINNVLTVEATKAGSHRKKGWEKFTESVFKILNESDNNIVFVLWGNDAIKKEILITNPNHLIIKSPHPSPLSAYRGFFSSKPFSQINNFLISKKIKPISW